MKTINDLRLLMRRAEVADMLGVSVSTVDGLRRRGLLQPVIFEGNRRATGFRPMDVMGMLADSVGADAQAGGPVKCPGHDAPGGDAGKRGATPHESEAVE